jgi:predicted RecA/RadA family phage recombinase
MAKNEVYKDADYLSLPVANGTLSGGPVRVGGLNGVAQTDEGDLVTNEEGYASVALKGAFRVPVSTTTTLAIGDPVYIITASNILTTTANSGANPLFGHALSAKGSTANQLIIVRIAN